MQTFKKLPIQSPNNRTNNPTINVSVEIINYDT